METAEVSIGIVDFNGKVIFLNKLAAKLWGGKPKDYINKDMEEIFPKEIADKQLKFLQEVIKNNKKKTVDTSGAIAGKTSWQHITVQPIKGRQNEISSVLFVGTDITHRVEMEEKIRHQATHDNLTGLYNRVFFEEEIKRLDTDRQLPLSIIMGDLNGLKLVNDSLGHKKGDKLLGKVSMALKQACREEDIIARWGGDEFTILLPQADEKIAKQVCTRITKSCKELSKNLIPLSISLGYATKKVSTDKIEKVLARAENRMYTNKLLDSKSFHHSVVASLKVALEEKHYETEKHAIRMCKLAVRMGKRLNLQVSQIDSLELVALLHDVGKVGIPNTILKKKGKLTHRERKRMQKHAEIGYRIVRSIPELSLVAEEIWSHHENWDGSGYPRGIKKENIPFLSRIVSIIDAYDVMVKAKRPYKKNVTEKEAIKELENEAGKQFDPKLVKEFVKMLGIKRQT